MVVTTITRPADTAVATTTSDTRPSLWKPGLTAGVVAAVATTIVAAGARAVDVSLAAGGEAFPIVSFAQLTLFFGVVGVAIASVLRRGAARPRTMWIRTTVVLTVLSFVPDLVLDADAATKVTLMLAHVVAASIVIPAIARHLPEGEGE